VRDEQLTLLALCALEGVTGAQWQLIAREASTPTGFAELVQGVVQERSALASTLRRNLEAGLLALDAAREWVAEAHASAERAGAHLVTVLDTGYPLNLRRIANLPPFLYVRGELHEDDIRSVAVVGTRAATDTGRQQARKMARHLSEHGVTVVSGMAAGIDTAAHEAALEAGGRTVAVMGTGILHTYPKGNERLKDAIADAGAVVSQFWPDQPGGRHTFPMRNVVMSGISQGTVVIEASDTSGARMQARLAWEHGKRVYLLHTLVEAREWARDMVQARQAIEVYDIEDVLGRVQSSEAIREAARLREQLALELL